MSILILTVSILIMTVTIPIQTVYILILTVPNLIITVTSAVYTAYIITLTVSNLIITVSSSECNEYSYFQACLFFQMIDGANQKLLLYLHIPLFSYVIILSHTWYISLVPTTLFGIIISIVTNQKKKFKLNINLYFIVKPSSDTYITTAAGRLRRGDLLMGPPLKAGERWPP